MCYCIIMVRTLNNKEYSEGHDTIWGLGFWPGASEVQGFRGLGFKFRYIWKFERGPTPSP